MRSNRSHVSIPLFLFTVFCLGACSSIESAVEEEAPADVVDTASYERAERFLSWNLNRLIMDEPSGPVWRSDNRFWYRIQKPEGDRFYRVDPSEGVREPAFDHELLGEAIAETAESRMRDGRLPFRHFRYLDEERVVEFRYRGQIWQCNIEEYICDEPFDPPRPIPSSVDSPDGRFAAYIDDHNLWVYDRDKEKEIQLTKDGEHDYGYATDSQGWTRSDRPILKWSPDSRKIATFRQDDRQVERMRLLRMSDGRPELDEWPYALPGDDEVPLLERVIIDVEERSVLFLDLPPSHQRASNCCGLVRNGDWVDVEWSPDGRTLSFVDTSRDYQTVTLYLANPETGDVRNVYSETDPIFFESNLVSRGLPNWRVFHDSEEFLWFSRESGWGHLYLHDLNTGERKRAITSGEWNVLDIVRTDEENRQIYLTGVGREDGVDPYFTQFYLASIDDSRVERLTDKDEHYSVSLSPSANYFVTHRSRPDKGSVTELQSVEEGYVMTLGKPDLSLLKDSGFRMPRPFSVKARDGETDLYGLLVKPSDFDPENTYPIVVSIYPGPQVGSVGSRSFTTNRRGQAHALAELGFVVMLLDGLGTPFRSREFHTWWYGDMADNGLEDQVEALHQLSERFSWIDMDRVGIYGHSGGGYATVAAMMRFPDLFDVGVAGAGNHDNRGYTYYWGEKYQGPLEGEDGEDRFENQSLYRYADQLKGDLLISYGTMDDNVHPNMTHQLIDSLISANKDFDLMVFPNRNHGYAGEPYKIRLTWDYFVRHLQNRTPPREYSFGRQ